MFYREYRVPIITKVEGTSLKPLSEPKPRVRINEQREVYRQHRQRMANVKSKVNTHLPPPKVKLTGMHMDLSYMEMMTQLYRRSNNSQRTFTKSPERLAAGRWRNASVARDKERKQQENNKKLMKGGGLFDPDVNKIKKKRNAASKAFSYEIPLHVLHRYENLMNKCDVGMLCKVLRPRIFIDLAVKDTRIKGRMEIQLFTEACPEVVLEFMRICTMREHRRICFTRVFAPIWLEAKIELDDNREPHVNNIEHDFEVLNHGVDAGILSIPSRYVRGNKRSILSFTMSFKPLSILNGKRIAFGKVRTGLALLDRLQGIATLSGRPSRPIVLTDCGTL